MTDDNVVNFPGAGHFAEEPEEAWGGPRGEYAEYGKTHFDWMIRFYKRTGKKLTKKAQTELSPIRLFNKPASEVLKALNRAEGLRSNRDALLVCEVERFEGAQGWRPYPKDLLKKEASNGPV